MSKCKLNFDDRFLIIIIASIVKAINFRSSFNNINYHMDPGNYLSLIYDPFLILIKNIISIFFLIVYFIEIKLYKKDHDSKKKKDNNKKETNEEEFKYEKSLKDEDDLTAIESIILSNRLYEKKDKFCFVIKVAISIISIYIFEEIEIITINNHILDRLICSSRILFAMIGVLILSAILFHNKMHKTHIINFFIFKKHQIIPLSIICLLSVCIILFHAFGIARFKVLYNINFLYYIIFCILLGLELTLIKYVLEVLYISVFLMLGLKGILGTIVFIVIKIKVSKEEFFNFLDQKLIFQYDFKPENFHITLKIVFILTLIICQYLKCLIVEKFGEMHFLLSMMITDILFFPLYCIERFAIQRFDISTKEAFIFDTIINVIISIFMLVFNEILELNFWGINTNIRKNIIIREKIDKENLIELFDINNEDNILDDDE